MHLHPFGKMRSACNRCHAQKLRCVRKPGQPQCERCLRLDTLCRFAPRATRGSIKHRSVPPQPTPNLQEDASLELLPFNVEPGHGIDPGRPVQCDQWLSSSSPNITDMLNHETLQALEPMINEAPLFGYLDLQSWEPDRGILQFPEPPVSTTTAHQLATLSIALSELAAKLPSVPDEHTGIEPSDYTRSAHSPPKGQRVAFVLDDLFHLTTQFTDLVQDRLVNRISGPGDEAISLMVGSCHSRLMEMYLVIFSLIQRCVQHSPGPPHLRPDWALVLPKVQLGTLSAPALHLDADTPLVSEGRALMYMWMIAVFSSQLWTRLGDMVGGQHRGLVVAEGTKSLVHTVWTDMGDRIDSLLQRIEETQSLLQ